MKWTHEGQTQGFAQALALNPSILNAQIALSGDLGAGKTTLVRHLLRSLGVSGVIKSPTYGLVETYQGYTAQQGEQGKQAKQGQIPLSIWHMDFYRMRDPLEWDEAGLGDVFALPGLKIYEWPQRVVGLLPPASLEIGLVVNLDETRDVVLHYDPDAWSFV
jgi:tRNA threonylcarbamoyladenosine biosynthesis protein TsaE